MAVGARLEKTQRPCALGVSDKSVSRIMDLGDALRGQWLPVGRAEELPEIGSYFTWERTGIPTLLVRSTDEKIRGFYNSCRHRGAPVVRTPMGRSRAFRCQYHSWTYDSFGKLLSIPDERDFGDINRCAHGLIALPIMERGGWLWANPDGQAVEAAFAFTIYEPMLALQQPLIFQGRATITVKADWAQLQPFVQQRSQDQNLGPNFYFDQREACCYMLAVWPADAQQLTIEAVVIASDSDNYTNLDAQQYLDKFVADFALSSI